MSTNAQGDVLSVTVTGYPAKYKSFRAATSEDEWMLNFKSDASSEEKLNDLLNKQK